MFSFKRFTWFMVFGSVWLGVGLYLLILGLNFILQVAHLPIGMLSTGNAPFFVWVSRIVGGGEATGIDLIVLSLLMGHLKGLMVFRKSVLRMERRLDPYQGFISITKAVPIAYFFLIIFMMGLGISLRLFSVPLDIRGVVDVAVGSGLVRGGMFYFRQGFIKKMQPAS